MENEKRKKYVWTGILKTLNIFISFFVVVLFCIIIQHNSHIQMKSIDNFFLFFIKLTGNIQYYHKSHNISIHPLFFCFSLYTHRNIYNKISLKFCRPTWYTVVRLIILWFKHNEMELHFIFVHLCKSSKINTTYYHIAVDTFSFRYYFLAACSCIFCSKPNAQLTSFFFF